MDGRQKKGKFTIKKITIQTISITELEFRKSIRGVHVRVSKVVYDKLRLLKFSFLETRMEEPTHRPLHPTLLCTDVRRQRGHTDSYLTGSCTNPFVLK